MNATPATADPVIEVLIGQYLLGMLPRPRFGVPAREHALDVAMDAAREATKRADKAEADLREGRTRHTRAVVHLSQRLAEAMEEITRLRRAGMVQTPVGQSNVCPTCRQVHYGVGTCDQCIGDRR